MRKNLKRTLAVFCALAVFAGGILTGNGQVVKADGTGTETNEWSVMKDVNLGTGGTYVTTGFGLNMTKTAASKANYRLYVKMNIPESVYNAATANGTTTGTLHIEICQTTCDVKEYDFRVTDFKSGENEWTLPWTMATDNTGASLSATMDYCRIYFNTANVPLGNAVVYEMKAVYTPCKEWTVLDNADIKDYADGNQYKVRNLSINIAGTAGREITKEELALYVKMNIPDAVYNAMTTELKLELAKVSHDNHEYEFTVPKADLKAGDNVFVLPWTKAAENKSNKNVPLGDEEGYPTLDMTITYSRIFIDGAARGLGDTKITMKIVDTTPYIKEYAAEEGEWDLGFEGAKVTTPIYENKNLGLNIPAGVQKDNLRLDLTFDLTEAAYDSMKADASGRYFVELAQTECDKNNWRWKGNVKDLEPGTNKLSLYISKLETDNGLDLNQTVNYFRMFLSGGKLTSLINAITFGEVELVDASACQKEAGKEPKASGLSVSDVPDGYLFAGWYTDSACSNPLAGTSYGSAYAKFVREDMLYTKAQCREKGSSADIRFVTTVDSLKYREVGFDITINEKTLTKTSSVVYNKLYAVGSNSETITYKPTEIGATSKYFNTYTIEGIPDTAYDTPITVQAFWVTQDGTKVSGTERTFKLSDVINN